MQRAPPRGVVGAARRCAARVRAWRLVGRTCPCGSPRRAVCAGRRCSPPPPSPRRRPPGSRTERPLRRSARALRLPVSARLCGVAPGLRRGAWPGREGGRGRSARRSRFLRRRLHLPRFPSSAPRSRIPALCPYPRRSLGGAASRSSLWPGRCGLEPSFPSSSLLCDASGAPQTNLPV